MPVGANQMNLYLFELGMLTRVPEVEAEVAVTLALHPLLTAPNSIRYTDPTRSTVTQTVGGAIDTRGGRGLQTISMDGSFGVEDRRVGPFGGSGEERFQTFRAEIVRLGDAVTKAHVQAAVGGGGVFSPNLASPGLLEALKGFNEGTDSFFVNFYDFWNGETLQVTVQQFTHSRTHRGGGATGLVPFQLQLQEVGPAVSSSPLQEVLSTLMDVMQTWQTVNATIASFDPMTLAAGVIDVGSFFGARVVESVEAVGDVGAGIGNAVRLIGGASGTGTLPATADPSVGAFFGLVQNARRSVERSIAAMGTIGLQREPQVGRGAVNWQDPIPPLLAQMVENDLSVSLQAMLDDLSLQGSIGAFMGMDHLAFESWIDSDGLAGVGPVIAGTLPHAVTETDTEEAVEVAYGVPWAMVLALNNLTTEEAMIAGTPLEIPVLRPAGPQGIGGLPTFGSHLGQSAWGVDLDFDAAVDDDGEILTVGGPDVLRQGLAILVEAFGAEILTELDVVPEVGRDAFVAAKLRGLMLSDRRIVSIASIEVDSSGGAIEASVLATAINGGSVLVGGPS